MQLKKQENRNMNFQTYTLGNGLQIIHKPDNSAASYCGLVINTGSRDETEHEQGMAHFVEHMLFKGTSKRRSSHIINRLENVGGELNAYTSKEETVVYAAVLTEHTERAMELIGDMVFNSIFPQKEIEKEIEVVVDEILSYNDSPSELIYDDFEELLFAGHAIGKHILGKPEILEKFDSKATLNFVSRNYHPSSMVFFILGNVDIKKIIRWAEKYFVQNYLPQQRIERVAPQLHTVQKSIIKKNTHQTHYIIGNRAYNMHHSNRLGMYLLNNILGGPGMNSLLNLSLREKHGLVYNVESTYQPMTDTGMWTVYFGSETSNANKCEQLIQQELHKLRNTKLKDNVLEKYKIQLLGQMVIASENKEHHALSLGKSFLRYGKIDNFKTIRERIEAINANQLIEIANEIFDPQQLVSLKYE